MSLRTKDQKKAQICTTH